MSCNFLGETSTIMPKRGEAGNWVSPPLSVLCAHPRVAPLSHRFSPRTWSCRRCCPHIFSSFPRVHCPLSVAPGCFFPLLLGSRRLPRCPPPLLTDRRRQTLHCCVNCPTDQICCCQIDQGTTTMLQIYQGSTTKLAHILSSLSLLSSQMNVVKRNFSLSTYVEGCHNVASWPTISTSSWRW